MKRQARGLAIFGPSRVIADDLKSAAKITFERLDSAFSKFIIRRDTPIFGKCPFCRVRPIQCAFHFITRAKESVRWHKMNAVGSCFECNGRYENEAEFAAGCIRWLIERIGQEAYDALVREGNRIVKFTQDDRESILGSLR